MLDEQSTSPRDGQYANGSFEQVTFAPGAAINPQLRAKIILRLYQLGCELAADRQPDASAAEPVPMD